MGFLTLGIPCEPFSLLQTRRTHLIARFFIVSAAELSVSAPRSVMRAAVISREAPPPSLRPLVPFPCFWKMEAACCELVP